MQTTLTILVVDDDTSFATALAALLSRDGHQVDTAAASFRPPEPQAVRSLPASPMSWGRLLLTKPAQMILYAYGALSRPA